MHAGLLIGFGALLLATPVCATTIVVHGSVGRACYEATLREAIVNDSDIRTACDAAVNAADGDEYDHLAALVNRSDIRLRLKDFRGAVADAQQAAARNPELAAAQLNLGAALVGLKQYEEALGTLDKALLLHPDHPELAYYNRALAREALGDVKGAYRDYRNALDAAPKFQLAIEELARFQVIQR